MEGREGKFEAMEQQGNPHQGGAQLNVPGGDSFQNNNLNITSSYSGDRKKEDRVQVINNLHSRKKCLKCLFYFIFFLQGICILGAIAGIAATFFTKIPNPMK